MADNAKHRKDRAMPGEISWFELPAEDTARARQFYGELFGWRTTAFDGDYHVIDNGSPGAIAPKDVQLSHPRIYFATADIDASAKRVHELGGTAEEIMPVPGMGRIVHCKDDQGTPFSLYQADPQA
jgi:uncharacterized protein